MFGVVSIIFGTIVGTIISTVFSARIGTTIFIIFSTIVVANLGVAFGVLIFNIVFQITVRCTIGKLSLSGLDRFANNVIQNTLLLFVHGVNDVLNGLIGI